ncbi:DUF6087 family protein [Streptomyces sp. NPDC056883]|uniref:DUF6087 family protein n=1 Tax=Streptomyces sp. NPDC056883 TaxID=3345959 RepID=UPI00369FB9D7
MEEEPLDKWAQRFLARQQGRVGRLRAVPMAPGPARAAHVEPDKPRVIERWDGYSWLPYTRPTTPRRSRSCTRRRSRTGRPPRVGRFRCAGGGGTASRGPARRARVRRHRHWCSQ